MQTRRCLRLSFLLLVLSGACDSDTNVLHLTTPSSHLDSFEVHLALAEAYLDDDNAVKATKHGGAAYRLNPYSEDAALTYGYALIALNGLSMFALVEKMDSSSDSEASSSASSFGPLDSLLGLSEDEFVKLGTLNTTIADLPIIVPVCASEARAKVASLYNTKQAIQAVCKFVDPEARVDGDWRHECVENSKGRERQMEAHFLWAMSHISEAIAFNKVINYKTVDKEKTNLELRLERLQKFDPSNVAQVASYVTNIVDFSQTITKILDVDGSSCPGEDSQSQFMALINDLIASSAAFSAMPNVPESITKSVTAAMDKVKAIQAKGDQASSQVGQANSFKQDLTKNMSKALSKSIAKIDSSKLSDAQKEQICSAYSQVSGGEIADPNLPALCK